MAEQKPKIDPFTTPLDRLSYDALFEAFSDIGSETQRLEFKQQIELEELARQATAMANGSGGLIVVGFKDPRAGAPLQRHPLNAVLDEPARRRLLSKIQARVYPSLPLDAATYSASDGSHQALVLRVHQSSAAPHENLNDRGRFVIRRGTEICGMTLRELEAQIQRRDNTEGRSMIVHLASVHDGLTGSDLQAADAEALRSTRARVARYKADALADDRAAVDARRPRK